MTTKSQMRTMVMSSVMLSIPTHRMKRKRTTKMRLKKPYNMVPKILISTKKMMKIRTRIYLKVYLIRILPTQGK